MYTITSPALMTAGIAWPILQIPSVVMQAVAALIILSAAIGLTRLGPRFALDYVRGDHEDRHRLRLTKNGVPVRRRGRPN